jgi:hypothetical protein
VQLFKEKRTLSMHIFVTWRLSQHSPTHHNRQTIVTV